jgi:hypothetical protein
MPLKAVAKLAKPLVALKGTYVYSLLKVLEGSQSISRRSEEERMRVSLLMG